MLFLKYRICPSNPFLAEKTYVRHAPVIFPGACTGLCCFLYIGMLGFSPLFTDYIDSGGFCQSNFRTHPVKILPAKPKERAKSTRFSPVLFNFNMAIPLLLFVSYHCYPAKQPDIPHSRIHSYNLYRQPKYNNPWQRLHPSPQPRLALLTFHSAMQDDIVC